MTEHTNDRLSSTSGEGAQAQVAPPIAGAAQQPHWLANTWSRIKHHKVMHWTLAYAAAAYTLLHGVEMLSEAQEWPHVIVRAFSLVLVLGVPVVMTLAWYHGAKGLQRVSGPELVIITILLVIAGTALWRFTGTSEDDAKAAAVVTAAPTTGTGTGAVSAAAPISGNAFAVLPFVNLSADPNQEYFSDGLTEEITAALARIPDLKVVGRTSAFQFKGQNKDMRAIGQTLGARYLLEGSVRKAGDRLRVTAQLIEANNGTHLWTDTYDRKLTDVFAIQEDIARAIAAALRAPLKLAEGERLVANRTDDTTAYDQYLRSRGLVRARSIDDAIELLENVVERDPRYAPAWALLAYARALGQVSVPSTLALSCCSPIAVAHRHLLTIQDSAESAAQMAVKLDARSAGGYMALGYIESWRGHWERADELFRKSLNLDAQDPDTLLEYGIAVLAATGQIKRALEVVERARTLEPLLPIYGLVAGQLRVANGDSDGALRRVESIYTPGSKFTWSWGYFLANVYANAGRPKDAATVLLSTRGDAFIRQQASDAAAILRAAPATAGEPEKLPQLNERWAFAYAAVGANARAMELFERLHQIGANTDLWFVMSNPLYAPIRKTDRFKQLMRDAGLVDYWKAHGWGDVCKPAGKDDFVCS